MNPAAILASYAAALALVFGAAIAVGNAVGPVGTVVEERGGVDHSQMDGMTDMTQDQR